jgi:hypothetical protein
MRLAALAVAGMSLVLFRIINDLKALRRQGLSQLALDGVCDGQDPVPSCYFPAVCAGLKV